MTSILQRAVFGAASLALATGEQLSEDNSQNFVARAAETVSEELHEVSADLKSSIHLPDLNSLLNLRKPRL